MDLKHAAVFAYCRARGFPDPVEEFRFHPGRKFAFDLCWVDERLALEIDGGLYGKGKPCVLCKRRAVAGHSSIQRIKSDMEKFNLAAVCGFRVLHCRPEQIASGEIFSWLDMAFSGRGS